MHDLTPVDRSVFLRTALAGVAGLAGVPFIGMRSEAPARVGGESSRTKVLLAYFSRPGENYYYGGRVDLKVGKTEVVARMIGKLIRCDVHRIEAASPYPHDYEKTVARNTREQNANSRPRIRNPLRSIKRYDVVLLASPIWNVRAPMIMSTFAESHDFTGKTVYPVTTYAISGLGTTPQDYAVLCRGARIGKGLAVQGEKARRSAPAVEAWLRRAGLLTR